MSYYLFICVAYFSIKTKLFHHTISSVPNIKYADKFLLVGSIKYQKGNNLWRINVISLFEKLCVQKII